MLRRFSLAIAALIVAPFLLWPLAAQATDASIYFSPNSGEFLVGSTLDVSIVVNTGDHSINALQADITFPADKLQVISPSVGTSFISIWTAQPTYSNTAGTLSFAGGLPNPGIKSSSAVLATIQFRVKSAGNATLKFGESTQILANDG
ncbi:MAG: cohesin domain-containing protein, partial [Patescibacteria group bacterium]